MTSRQDQEFDAALAQGARFLERHYIIDMLRGMARAPSMAPIETALVNLIVERIENGEHMLGFDTPQARAGATAEKAKVSE